MGDLFPAELLTEVARYSVLLPVIALQAWFIVVQHRAAVTREAQHRADILAIIGQLMTLNDKFNSTISTATLAFQSTQAHAATHDDIVELREKLSGVSTQLQLQDRNRGGST